MEIVLVIVFVIAALCFLADALAWVRANPAPAPPNRFSALGLFFLTIAIAMAALMVIHVVHPSAPVKLNP